MSISSASIPGISTSMEQLFLDSTILQAGLKSLFTKGMLDKTGSSKKRWNMPSNSFLKRFNGNSSGFIFFGFIESTPIQYKLTIYIYYRSEEHTSELQSRFDIVCRLLLEKKK